MTLLKQSPRGFVAAIRRTSGGLTWCTSSAAPIRGIGSVILGAVLSLTDITRLHELEEQRENHVRAISDDLRNPLTTLIGQAQLAEERLQGTDERLAQSTGAIVAGGRRMAQVIDQLIDSTRLETLPAAPGEDAPEPVRAHQLSLFT